MGVLNFLILGSFLSMQCASQADEESWMIVAPQRNIRTFTDASVGPNSFDEPGIELSQVEGSVSLGVVTRAIRPQNSCHTCGTQTGTVGGLRFVACKKDKGTIQRYSERNKFPDDFIVPDYIKFTDEQKKLHDSLLSMLAQKNKYYDIPDTWKAIFGDFAKKIESKNQESYLSVAHIKQEQKWFEDDSDSEWEIVPEDVGTSDSQEPSLQFVKMHKEQCDKDQYMIVIDPEKRSLVMDVIKLIAFEWADLQIIDFLCAICGGLNQD